MRKYMLCAAAAASLLATPALAQDATYDTTAASQSTGATAPDGTPAFGIEPYFGVMGAWESFDIEPNKAGIPAPNGRGGRLDGYMVQGVAGVNVPLGAFFIGGEGFVAKGIEGDIDWQYGAAGRAGIRVGDSGMFYGKVGYQWNNFDKRVPRNRDYNDWTFGAGYEVGPKDIGLGGITGNSGFRLRGEIATFGDFHSLRPSLGVITHF